MAGNMFITKVMLVLALIVSQEIESSTEVSSISDRQQQNKRRHCPAGYMHYGKSCYLLTPEVVKWTEAYVYCQSFGSHLVYIETASEQKHIDSFLKFVKLLSAGRIRKYWTGGIDRVSKGRWFWAPDGKPVNFTNWAPRKPDSGVQDCIALYGNGQWDDDTCESARNFICEVELD
ncbi:perlucin-like [Ruditapes philippinarum]|uniref:perlucin-like n=1 Tax=Ruditapes philippinarum TaxID=129788 RepID=UPI00295B8E97|nr:perlucin-like [Ruditapes philippinarum]